MHRGYVKVYRKMADSWITDHPDKFQAWIKLLWNVNHSPREVIVGDEVFSCSRGQAIKSLDTWASIFSNSENRWDIHKTRRFLKLLQDRHMITLERVGKTQRLTCCNYCTYND